MNRINDPGVPPEERLAVLWVVVRQESFLDWVVESNNHIHTYYSFSPYTPFGAALGARRAGLYVVSSVDHDSIVAAAEMAEATRILGVGSATGFECRAFLDPGGPFATRKLNDPDSAGVAYMTMQTISAPARAEVDVWFAPRRAARLERTLAMAETVNSTLIGLGLASFDPQTNMVSRSQYATGGDITERHLLAAMADALIDGSGRGEALVKGLQGMGIDVPAKLAGALGDADNPYLTYDLLGVFKSEYLTNIYIQPTADECPTAEEAMTLADSIGAITTYAYLGDVSASLTDDKKAEKFEGGYLDELFDAMAERRLWAVTYMLPRNTPQQLRRIHDLAARHGMYEISGMDINQPRQPFTCPELRDPRFAALNEAAWALVAHKALATVDPSLYILGEGRPRPEWLAARIAAFASFGRTLADGVDAAELAVTIPKLRDLEPGEHHEQCPEGEGDVPHRLEPFRPGVPQ